MRLTLRTMLAYLDDILEPADSDDIGKKIEESEFATNLVQRIRNSITMPRLGAPKPLATGETNLDANAVAEYLDNILPPEQIPDFEKRCLESDVHLAEVASSHQVLTLVLGTPAEVTPETRQRMYRLIVDADAEPSEGGLENATASGATAATAAARNTSTTPAGDRDDAAAANGGKRKKKEVPDYLKSSSKMKVWPIAVTVALAFLLAGAVFMAMGPPNMQHPLARLVGLGSDNPGNTSSGGGINEEPAGTSGENDSTGPVGVAAGGPAEVRPGPGEPVSPSGASTGAGANSGNGNNVSANTGGTTEDDNLTGTGPRGRGEPSAGAQTPPVPGPSDLTTGPSGGAGMEPPIVPNFPGAGAGAGAGAGEGNGGVDGGVVAPPSDRVAGVDFPGAGESTPAARGDFPGGVGSGVPGGAPTTEGGPPAGGTESAAHSGAEVGRYVSDQQVLMRLDPASGRWNLVPSRGTLAVGDRLLSLPTYRPQITLASGVQVTLVGPAAVTVIAPGPDGTPYLQVDYGRLLVLTIGRPGTRLGLKLGQVTGMVSFGDPDATMAISVEQLRVSGVQPKSAETHTKVTLMPTSGSLGWQRGSSELEKLDAGVKHVIFDELAGGTVESGPLPGWIDGSDLPKIDQRASRDLMPALGEDRPPVLVLRERSEDRRVEIRSLAARCLSYMDEFDPLVSALRDDQQRSSWTAFFGAIQNALARGEKSSAALRDSMLKVRGEVGEELYRLTWGFNNEQLKEGGAARLVELLDHEEMDVRVLAFENLVQITGKTLLYRPEYNSAQRKRYIRPWSEKLDAGEIAWQQPPPSAKLPAPAPGGGTPGGDRPATIPPR